MQPDEEIHALLEAFQLGYLHRSVDQLDSFMELFLSDAEVIGTNGSRPGLEEWYLDRAGARELVRGDWEFWGDLRLDLGSASIRASGDAGWVAATATVTMRIGAENYAAYLASVKAFIEESPLPPEEKLHYILRGGTNTVYELHRGEVFVWPLRLTAVVLRQAEGWKIAQLHFSFPTAYFPDVRLLERSAAG